MERPEAKLGARRRFEERTYYEMLEVSPRASRREVDAAYAGANELYRSDSLPLYTFLEGQAYEEVRRAIDAAYRTLADERARAEYDRHLVSSGRLAPEDVRPQEESPTAPSEEGAHAAPAHAAAGQVIPIEAHVARSAPTPTLASGQEAPADAPDLVEAGPTTAHRVPPPGANELSRAQAPAEADKAKISSPESGLPRPVAEGLSTDSEQSTDSPAPRPGLPAGPAGEQPDKSEQEKPQRLDGPGLKAIREAQGRDLESIARVTKISTSKLMALESNSYSNLPVRVYLNGFVKEYARALGLDPDKVAEEYLRRSGR